VLVAEDDETIRRLLVEYLQSRMNVAADVARDGVEALHQVSTNVYDVVVLDVMMPKMSGVDFLDSLKALASDPSLEWSKRPPAVVVVTAASDDVLPDETIVERCPGMVRAVFRKPIDVRSVGRAVEQVIGKR